MSCAHWLVDEMRALPDAVFVPLGPKVSEALEIAAPLAGLDPDRVLSGLPHPSGASAERIAYFLGRKRREARRRPRGAHGEGRAPAPVTARAVRALTRVARSAAWQ